MSDQLESEIAKHRPRPEAERNPSGRQALEHLNTNGLLEQAIERQRQRNAEDQVEGPVVITRLVAWEVLGDARRAGAIAP